MMLEMFDLIKEAVEAKGAHAFMVVATKARTLDHAKAVLVILTAKVEAQHEKDGTPVTRAEARNIARKNLEFGASYWLDGDELNRVSTLYRWALKALEESHT